MQYVQEEIKTEESIRSENDQGNVNAEISITKQLKTLIIKGNKIKNYAGINIKYKQNSYIYKLKPGTICFKIQQ